MDFFILGNPRSGTTLLRLMLNNHSKIGVPPESGFLQWWYQKYKLWSLSNTKNNDTLDSFLDDILNSKKIEGWDIDRDALKKHIVLSNPNNYSEIIDCIYKYHTNNKEYIGDKNNYYIHHLDELHLIYPVVKYIHLVRDGRDVACSYKNINKLDSNLKYLPKVSSNIEEIALEWNNNINTIEKFTLSKESITIRYEDLIENTSITLKKICHFLNVDFNKSMLTYYENNDEPSSTMHWKGKTNDTIDSSNKNNYLKFLSDREIKKFNNIALNNLKKFDYE